VVHHLVSVSSVKENAMRRFLGIAPVILALAATWAWTEDTRPADSTGLDKKVVEIVKQVGKLYKNARSLHADATLANTVEAGKEKRQNEISMTFDVERPNRFALRSRFKSDPNAGLEVVCDGKKLYAHGRRLKQYTEGAAPAKMEEVGRTLARFGHPTTGLLFQNLLEEDPDETLLDGVTACSYAGKDKVADQPAHHLTFTQPEFEWEMWVAAEGKPVVLKVVTTHSTDEARRVTVETYSNWKLDAAPPREAFAFTPPADAKKVKVLGGR
jgi:hypothetical protein